MERDAKDRREHDIEEPDRYEQVQEHEGARDSTKDMQSYQAPEVELEAEEDKLTPEEYVPATTWDGLEHLGHKGHWADLPPTAVDTYKS